MKKFLLIIAAIFCCTLGVNAQETPDYFCLTFDMAGTSKTITLQQYGSSFTYTPVLEYSKDKLTWTNVVFGQSISVGNGDNLYLRAGQDGTPGINATFSESTSKYIYMSWPTYQVNSISASGNIMSLLDGKDFETLDAVPSYAFHRLFAASLGNNTVLKNVGNLRLPATTLSDYCYSYMFYKCTGITQAPKLPATTLKKYCYQYMFNGCSSLCDIEVNFTTWPGSSGDDAWGTSSWVTGVAETGTFTCPEDLPHEGSSYFATNRIPTGWTVSVPVTNIEIDDAEEYKGAKDRTATVTYKRNFESTVWQPLYVPFSIVITEDLLQDCDIADIFMVSTKGSVTAGDDPVDEGLSVTVIKKFIEGDQTEPHTPYFIRPKATGDFEFTQENTTVYAVKEGMVDCSTTKDKYEFIGNYSAKTLSPTTGIAFYVLGTSGGLKRVAKTADYDLAANRWCMQKKSKSGTVALDADEKMSVVVLGEDDTTGIEGIEASPKSSPEGKDLYNLQGQRVNTFNGYRGMVVKGGKKFIVK